MFRKVILLAALLGTALALTVQGTAARAQTRALAAPAPQADVSDARDVETFMDGFITAQLAARNIAGASVAVVSDGKVILVKGYGYADPKTMKPVDGETTLFRPGSVSKLFVWTSVMQLVEQGKINLDADVNTYLTAFKIPEAYGRPITMFNLMTHTPGFEDSSRDLVVKDPANMEPLGDYLVTHIPARVYPPGRYIAYSNYGASLAAYIVQEVSGLPFEEYIEKNIFEPLGMDHTTFRQPLPDALAGDMSGGFAPEGGVLTARDFEIITAFPAGALSATATDMAKFMIAHLQDGEYEGARILKAETARTMHSQDFTPSPEIEGMAHGFYATTINGRRIIQHGGDTVLFHSELMLIPEEGVGLYVSYNSQTGGVAGVELQAVFMDRYFPPEGRELKPPADFQTRLASYVGSYRLARMNFSTPEKVVGAFQSFNVAPGRDNTLLVTSIRNPGGMDQWVEVKPGVLKPLDGDDTMVFLDEANGQYQTAYISSIPVLGAVRSPWYAAPSFNIGLLIVCLILLLTGLLAAPVGLFGPRVKPPEDEPHRGRRLAARWVAFGFCLLNIAFVVGFGVWLMGLSTDLSQSWRTVDALTWLPRAGVILALGMTGLAYFVWREKYWSLAGRIHYTLLAVMAWALIWFEVTWRLMG